MEMKRILTATSLLIISVSLLTSCSSVSSSVPSSNRTNRTTASQNDNDKTPESDSLIASGFYKVTPLGADGKVQKGTDEIVGDIVFLHEELYFNSKTNLVFNGIRGIFDKRGVIFSTIDSDQSVTHHWSFKKETDPQGTVVISHENDQTLLTLSFPPSDSTKRLLLTYIGRSLLHSKHTFLSHHGSPYNRGLNNNGIYPENSLASFQESLRAGYDGFEVDVRITKDQKYIAFHDSRLALDSTCRGKVSSWLLEDLEKNCSLDHTTVIPNFIGKKAKKISPMDSLKSILEETLPDPRLKTLAIDIKPSSDEDIVAGIQDALQNIHDEALLKKIIFISRTDTSLTQLKTLFPSAHGALEGKIGREPSTHLLDFAPGSNSIKNGNHTVVSFGMWVPILQEMQSVKIHNFIKIAHENGYTVMAWTAKRPKTLQRAMRNFSEFDMLMSDVPFDVIAREELREHKLKTNFKLYEDGDEDDLSE